MSVENHQNYGLRLALMIKRVLEEAGKPMTTAELTAAVQIQLDERKSLYNRHLLRRNIIRIGKLYQRLGEIQLDQIPTVRKAQTYKFTLLKKHP